MGVELNPVIVKVLGAHCGMPESVALVLPPELPRAPESLAVLLLELPLMPELEPLLTPEPPPLVPELEPASLPPELPLPLPPVDPPELPPDEEDAPLSAVAFPPEPEQAASAPTQAESPPIAQHALLLAPRIVVPFLNGEPLPPPCFRHSCPRKGWEKASFTPSSRVAFFVPRARFAFSKAIMHGGP
jgi:hypothetical protein